MISLEEELQQLKEEMERVKAKSNVSSSLPYMSIHMYSTCPHCISIPVYLPYNYLSIHLPKLLVYAYLSVLSYLPSLSDHIYLTCASISTQLVHIYQLIHLYLPTCVRLYLPFIHIYQTCRYLPYSYVYIYLSIYI